MRLQQFLPSPHKLVDTSVIGSSIGIINAGGTLGGLGQLIKIGGGSFIMSFGFMALASILCGLTVVFGLKKGAE
ncbi:MAG TPA: hypothetical protein PK268_00880 [Enterococcus sp.]|nr:hypothetical protein [Enterococcus sp.]